MQVGCRRYRRAAIELKCNQMTTILAALKEAQDAAEEANKAHTGMVTADKEAASRNILIRQACDVIARMDGELPMDKDTLEEARRSLGPFPKQPGARPPSIYDSSSKIGSPARFAAPRNTVTE